MKTIRGFIALELLENLSPEDLEPIGMFPVYSSIDLAELAHPDAIILPVEVRECEITQH